jgi:hypothetical protein
VWGGSLPGGTPPGNIDKSKTGTSPLAAMPIPLPVTIVGGLAPAPVTINNYWKVDNEMDIYKSADLLGQALREQTRY